MAKFLNKKEQVYEINLTTYGRYLFSLGKFQPKYYAFYDDSILYDSQYAMTGGVEAATQRWEPQNDIHGRIKNDTQYFAGPTIFRDIEEMEWQVEDGTSVFDVDITPTQQRPKEALFRLERPIGDVHMAPSRNEYASAWKLAALQGIISSSQATGDSRSDITQINIDLNYTKKINYLKDLARNNMNSQNVRDLTNRTDIFSDGTYITLETDDPLIYLEELNTALLTENFDLEVFHLYETSPATFADARILVSTLPSFELIQNNDTIIIEHKGNTDTFTFKKPMPGSPADGDFELVAPPASATTTEVFNAAAATWENLLDAINIFGSDALGLTATAGNFYDPTGELPSIVLTSTFSGLQSNRGSIKATLANAAADVTIHPWNGGSDNQDKYKRKYFKQQIDNVQDGYMVANTAEQSISKNITTASVEYYFDIKLDQQIDSQIACKGASVFNKESYYVHLDFECESEEMETVYYDIYGQATEPEICQ